MSDWLERRREILREIFEVDDVEKLQCQRDGLVAFLESQGWEVDWEAYKQDTGYRSPRQAESYFDEADE